jgi:catechol 2,3-dioxygenase-like lactoylglutathione lyase family enzyme
MSSENSGRLLPGAVRQIGYVVRDLDAAIESWVALGVGPWFTIRRQRSPNWYRGEPSEPVISLAFANSDELQIELIQQEDDAPSIYREFLDAGNEGFHQLAWWAEDFDGVMARATAAGWSVVCSGGGDGGARFAYLDLGGATSTVVEVMELNDATRWLARTVRDAARDWNGAGPHVRELV